MRVIVLVTWCVLGCLMVSLRTLGAGEHADPQRWQETIDAMVADAPAISGSGTICFIGSSSIRLWDLDRWFPQLATVNRGFGGSHIADSTHYAEALIYPHQPDTVVFYAGDNDIAHGLTPDQVAEDYRKFVAKIRTRLPEVRLLYIAIKPSIARWDKYPLMAEANSKIRELTASDPLSDFVDICPAMFDGEGQPKRELFLDDGLHLNEAGYRLWTRLVHEHLKSEG